MSKHTPGTWRAIVGEDTGVIDQAVVFSDHQTEGEDTYIADTMGIDDVIPLEQRRANAFLIAGSPGLLVTGEELCAAACDIHPTASSSASITRLHKAIDAWETAVAKAKGVPIAAHSTGEHSQSVTSGGEPK